MIKISITRTIGGASLAAAAVAPKAEAACWWTGYAWDCGPPPQTAYYYPPAYQPVPLSAYPRAPWGYGYGNSNKIPNDYPGPALTHEGF